MFPHKQGVDGGQGRMFQNPPVSAGEVAVDDGQQVEGRSQHSSSGKLS